MTIQLILIAATGLLYMICTNSAHAVERIPVPDSFPPHPRLFMDQSEIDQLRTWADTEPWAKERIAGFISYNLQDANRVLLAGSDPNIHNLL